MRWDLYSVSQQKPDNFWDTLHKYENLKSNLNFRAKTTFVPFLTEQTVLK